MNRPATVAAPQQPRPVVDGAPLDQAARLVGGVLSRLNVTSETCARCGRPRDLDFTQAETARVLRRIVKDLRFYARVLGDGVDLLAERRKKKEAK